MRSPEELKEFFEFAQSQDLPWIEVDGVKLPVPKKREPAAAGPQENPEIFLDPCSQYTDEEILFYSTPYFDELQAKKEDKERHAKETMDLRRSG